MTAKNQDKSGRVPKARGGGVGARASETGKSRDPDRLAPQQERSRESLRKLMKATREVMGQHGLDGATIPRIAAHARSSRRARSTGDSATRMRWSDR